MRSRSASVIRATSADERSWFLRLVAHAGGPVAARAACGIFCPHRNLKIHTGAVGEGREPGEDVRELRGLLLGRPPAQRGRQLPDLLHEPHEGAFDPAALV